MKKLLPCFLILKCSLLMSQDFMLNGKIDAFDKATLDYFGWSVAIDENLAVVGAAREDDDVNGANFIEDAGSVYIFERDTDGNWQFFQKIVASDRSLDDEFGLNVAVKGDFIFVGVPDEDEDENATNTLENSGAVYIFERQGNGNFIQTQKLVSFHREIGGKYGQAIAVHNGVLIVGAPQEDTDQNNMNPIASAGAAYIYNLDMNGVWGETQKIITSFNRGNSDTFGEAVAIYNNALVVGAGGAGSGNTGEAYLFENTGNQWEEVQKIVASDGDFSDDFGYSLAMVENFLLVGSKNDVDLNGENNLNDAGAAYIFQKNEGSGDWLETQKIVASNRAASDNFSNAVAMDSEYAFIGAWTKDDDNNGAEGATYMFRINDADVWEEINILLPNEVSAGDSFGYAIAFDGNTMISSGIGDNFTGATNAGSAYIYEKNPELSIVESVSPVSTHIYPNPAKNLVTITSDKKIDLIKVYNVLGQLILETTNTYFEFGHSRSGVYMIEIYTENQKTIKRLIKQ